MFVPKKSKTSKVGDVPDDVCGAVAEDVLDVEDVLKRPDPSEGAAVVVIHPGSTNLRIGLASSPTPRVRVPRIRVRALPPASVRFHAFRFS